MSWQPQKRLDIDPQDPTPAEELLDAAHAWPMGEGPWARLDRIAMRLPASISWLWLSKKGRYLIAGGWNTLVGSLIFWVLYWALGRHTPYLVVGFMSHFLAVGQAYVVQRSLVFRMVNRSHLSEFLRFNVGYIGTLALSLVLLWLFVGRLGLSPYFAQAGIAIFGAVAGYVFHSKVSFSRSRSK